MYTPHNNTRKWKEVKRESNALCHLAQQPFKLAEKFPSLKMKIEFNYEQFIESDDMDALTGAMDNKFYILENGSRNFTALFQYN